MKILSCLILFCLIAGKSFSQNCKIDNPLLIDKTSINEASITSKIKEIKKVFKSEDIKTLEKQIIECNNGIDNSIAKLKTTIMNFSLDKQELLKMKDLKKIQEQIEEKQKSREKIKEQIQSDLITINLKGLYLCVMKDLDPMSHSPAELADKSKSIIAPTAIEFINGTFITSVTNLYKSNKQESLTTYIKGIISGELGVEKVAFSKRANGQTQFIYIAKISVSPLKKAINTKEIVYGDSKKNTLVINLLNENDYKNKLKNFGISESDIVDVENQINTYKELINEENELSKKQEQNILSNGNTNLDKIDSEISDLQSQFNSSGTKVKSLIESKTNIKYIKDKHEACINEALTFFDNKIRTTYQQIVDLKEQELVGMYDRNVSNEGSPADDIAKTAMNLYDQIKKNYSKLEQFLKIQELLNNEFSTNQQGQNKVTYREIEKIWLFPVPGDDNNYKLTLIAKFKIKGESNISTSDKTIAITGSSNSDSFKDIRDGKIYKIVKIGEQIWMAENLNFITSNGSWCYEGNCDNLGRLYDWQTAKTVCPSGWHLPSDAEWNLLSDNLGGESNAGDKMKETGTLHWYSPNAGSDNSSGFTALPGGYRNSNGTCYDYGTSGYWWSSLENGTYKAWLRYLSNNKSNVYRDDYNNISGISVRCVKNK